MSDTNTNTDTNDALDYIGANELIFNADKDLGIYSGGFSVNSILMKAGMSPIMTLNNQLGGGSKKVSDLFENLVVPNWALSYSNKMMGGGGKHIHENEEEDEDIEDIDDNLHDKLLELVKEHDTKIYNDAKIYNENKLKQIKKRKTKKHKLDDNNKNHKRATKRNYKKK